MTIQYPKLSPMLATLGAPFDSDEWVYEIKWDGLRALAYMVRKSIHIVSRNENYLTDRYPELTDLLKSVTIPSCILDGEIVTLIDGKPSFQALLHRDKPAVRGANPQLRIKHPITFVVFDILAVEERMLINASWFERRKILEEVVKPSDHIVLTEPIDASGIALLEACRAMSLEGVIAKKKLSLYYPGKRSKSWIKFKLMREMDAFLVGFTSGNIGENIGSLALAVEMSGDLLYIGNVGVGITAPIIAMLLQLTSGITSASPPCKGIPRDISTITGWVQPSVKIRVRYLELTADGQLRHPVFIKAVT